MKFRLGLACLLSSAALASAADRHIVFERDQAVWIANLDGTAEKKVADGIFPAISPDGTRIAFTSVTKSGTSYTRQIAVIDLATNKVNLLKDVPSDNSYYPSWSPDGARILFTLRVNEVWDLALIKPDGSEFHTLKKGSPDRVTLYSPCWAPDGKSVFCQDMTTVFQLGLDGAVMNQWNVEKVIPNGNMSGDGRIDVSPDGKLLLLSIDMGEEANRKNWDGPVPALWTFEMATQKAVRVTPGTLFGWDGCWMDDENILFLSQTASDTTASINRISITGRNFKRLIGNARMPSVSR